MVLELANSLSYKYRILHKFLTFNSINALYKNQAAKFPAILDSFLLVVDCIRQIPIWVWVAGAEAGKIVILIF